MRLKIDIKTFSLLTIAFILFTAIGAISHEYGHILVAKVLGYETTLHYGSISYNSALNDKLIKIYENNKAAIENRTDFEQKVEYYQGIEKLKTDGLYITLGGPVQTTFIGLTGFLILLFRRRKIKVTGLKVIDWLAVFLALFWLREVFNLVMSIRIGVTVPNGSFFSGDERRISEMLNLWEGAVPIALGLIGLAISLFTIFKIIPRNTRFTFILSGLVGGVLGFTLWMNVIGPKLIP